MFKHGSLFSGIGGFDLAAQWCGWKNIFQVEEDQWCRKILKKNFPNSTRFEDIYEFNGEKYRDTIDIISGGFPCQPFSIAGKQKGKKDDRYLWPEMLRVIKEVRPSWIIGENVIGFIKMELNRTVFDLETIGYEVQVFTIPACAVDAKHIRNRAWIIAHHMGDTKHNGLFTPTKQRGFNKTGNNYKERKDQARKFTGTSRPESYGNMANPNRQRFQKFNSTPIPKAQGHNTGENNKKWREWPTEPQMGRMADGVSRRMDRIKGLGNAIVPQVAYEIFRYINLIEKGEYL